MNKLVKSVIIAGTCGIGFLLLFILFLRGVFPVPAIFSALPALLFTGSFGFSCKYVSDFIQSALNTQTNMVNNHTEKLLNSLEEQNKKFLQQQAESHARDMGEYTKSLERINTKIQAIIKKGTDDSVDIIRILQTNMDENFVKLKDEYIEKVNATLEDISRQQKRLLENQAEDLSISVNSIADNISTLSDEYKTFNEAFNRESARYQTMLDQMTSLRQEDITELERLLNG